MTGKRKGANSMEDRSTTWLTGWPLRRHCSARGPPRGVERTAREAVKNVTGSCGLGARRPCCHVRGGQEAYKRDQEDGAAQWVDEHQLPNPHKRLTDHD